MFANFEERGKKFKKAVRELHNFKMKNVHNNAKR
jgi:hypothetical protein